MEDNETLGFAASIEVMAYTLVIVGGGFLASGTLLSLIEPGATAQVLQIIGTGTGALGGVAWRLVTSKLSDGQ